MKTITDLKTIVELDNNYYLEIVNNTNNLPTEAIDIEKLNLIIYNKITEKLKKVL